MKLKSSKKQTSYFIVILGLITILLLSLKTINLKKKAKYPSPPEFEQKTPLDFIQLTLNEKQFEKLKKKRDIALSVGILETGDKDYVPATITFNGEDYKAEIRLKGDWTDHLSGDKWSFRIKLNDDRTILGMRKFSIHHPNTRGYLNEWLYHKAIKEERLIGLRYEFLEGSIHIKRSNSSKYINKEVGIYAIEETFDKRTLESNGRKESVILKFSENYWWNEVKKSINVGENSGLSWNNFFDYQLQFKDKSPIISFSQSKVLKDSVMFNYFRLSKNLLEDIRRGQTTLDKVFDLKQLAMQNAILNLFGATHGIYIINLRFYYNPITSQLEPIAFDGNSGVKLKKYEHFMFIDEEKDSLYLIELTNALEKVTNPLYVDKLFDNNKIEINNYQKFIKEEFKVNGIAKQNIKYNQTILKKELVRLQNKFGIEPESTIYRKPNRVTGVKTSNVSKWVGNGVNIVKTETTFNKNNVFSIDRKNVEKPAFISISNNKINYGGFYRASVVVKKKTLGDHFGIRIQGKYPNRVDAVFSLDKGELIGVLSVGNFENPRANIEDLGGGWYRCNVYSKIKTTSNVNIIFGPTNDERRVLSWEGSTSQKSNSFIVPSSLSFEEVNN